MFGSYFYHPRNPPIVIESRENRLNRPLYIVIIRILTRILWNCRLSLGSLIHNRVVLWVVAQIVITSSVKLYLFLSGF